MSWIERLTKTMVEVAETFANEIISTKTTPARKLTFLLAKRLRGVGGATEISADDLPDVILAPVAAFCRILHANPSDNRDLDFSEAAHDEVLVEVLESWNRVRSPGDGALAEALRKGDHQPLQLRGPLNRCGIKFTRLVSLEYHLQHFRGPDPIFLPVRSLGMLLMLDPSRVSRFLSCQRQHGLLNEVEKGSYKAHRATTYRFSMKSRLYLPPGVATAASAPVTREPGEDDDEPTPSIDVDALDRTAGRP